MASALCNQWPQAAERTMNPWTNATHAVQYCQQPRVFQHGIDHPVGPFSDDKQPTSCYNVVVL